MCANVRDGIREYGDFQTPRTFADEVCRFLFELGERPAAVVEPTCGEGNFLLSALGQFASASEAVGVDINATYIDRLHAKLRQQNLHQNTRLMVGDFFAIEWDQILEDLPEPILIVGNPPWVTNADLARLESDNLPQKSNLWNLSGLDSLTGKSNFDISEWMLIHLLKWIENRNAVLAMLCKTNVARKVLLFAWQNNISVENSAIYSFDADAIFNVSVDACLLVCKTSRWQSCDVYTGLSLEDHKSTFGFRDGELVSTPHLYDRWKHLRGDGHYTWRSGIKHDCSKVMELEREAEKYRNKLGEWHTLEDTYLYPMLKSSHVAKGDVSEPEKWMLVTQQRIGEDTTPIKEKAPKTWSYLQQHCDLLDGRKSSVYKNRPRFSIFGVGEYTFAQWKVAISGLYKKLHFAVVGPYGGKPIVLDDTCYFIPCRSQNEAEQLAQLLNSDIAQQFFEAFIFWDKKRPITASILNRLDIAALARELDVEDEMSTFLRSSYRDKDKHRQLQLSI